MYVQVPAVEIQIIVLSSDEKSAGMASVLKRSAVKKGTISVGVKVSVEEYIQCAVNIDDSGFVSPRKRKTTTAKKTLCRWIWDLQQVHSLKPQFPSKQWTDAGTLSPTRFNG